MLEELYNLLALYKENGYRFESIEGDMVAFYEQDVENLQIDEVVDYLNEEKGYWE